MLFSGFNQLFSEAIEMERVERSKSQPTFEPFEDDGISEKFKELCLNEELVDLFCEEMKKRLKVGDIAFLENNKWKRLNSSEKGELSILCRNSEFYNDHVATGIYAAMKWIND